MSASARAHNRRAEVVPATNTCILPMMCMKAGSDTVKSDGNRACSLRYPCPRAERGRGKWGDGIDGPDGPKEGAVRFRFDGNHREVSILFLEFRYEWCGLSDTSARPAEGVHGPPQRWDSAIGAGRIASSLRTCDTEKRRGRRVCGASVDCVLDFSDAVAILLLHNSNCKMK